mgnify:CR=1 FL=1
MKDLFDNISHEMSELTTKRYSTSFSLGISFLSKEIQQPIYAIYGFVRFADEIVDTFHDYPKAALLEDFKAQTYRAIEQGISLNPILNSFQWAVNKYRIPLELIETFLNSMEMDLEKHNYDPEKYQLYILGSAEVVGLMCLKIFVHGDEQMADRRDVAQAGLRGWPAVRHDRPVQPPPGHHQRGHRQAAGHQYAGGDELPGLPGRCPVDRLQPPGQRPAASARRTAGECRHHAGDGL